MELIERYIYAVTNKLPTNQRADIEKELRGLIEDMLEEQLQGREATDEDVQQVLAELGDPREMANRYRDAKQYLIGPELFSSYLSVLKIVIIAVSIAFAVLFCIESLLEPRTIAELFIDHLLGLIIAYFQAFTWVTIIFALIEFYTIRKGRSHKLSGSGAWKPSDLPQLPDHLTEIKRSGPIASIIFYTIAAGIILLSIEHIGVWWFQGQQPTVIPIFDEAVFRSFVPVILALFALAVIKNIAMLIKRRWTLSLIGAEILLSLLSFLLALWMFADQTVWNPDFIQQLIDSGMMSAASDLHDIVLRVWDTLQDMILYIISIIFIIDIVIWTVKGYRIKQQASV